MKIREHVLCIKSVIFYAGNCSSAIMLVKKLEELLERFILEQDSIHLLYYLVTQEWSNEPRIFTSRRHR